MTLSMYIYIYKTPCKTACVSININKKDLKKKHVSPIVHVELCLDVLGKINQDDQ